ncbi:hypothetical protein Dimus_037320 [Dionaea muscipula]
MGTRKQRSRSELALGPVVTVFLDNLPERMTAKDLFMLLNKFAVVSDVFIPWKRRVVTKSRFGFARVKGHSDADRLIRKVNGLWVMDQMVIVKEALIDYINGRGERARPMLERNKSYADALRGNRAGGDVQVAKGIHVQEERTRWSDCLAASALSTRRTLRLLRTSSSGNNPYPFS